MNQALRQAAGRVAYAVVLCWSLATLVFAATELSYARHERIIYDEHGEPAPDPCGVIEAPTWPERYLERLTTIGRAWTPPCAPITDTLADRLPRSAALSGLGVLAAWPASIGLAMLQGLRAGTTLDRALTAASVLLHAWPAFLVAMLVQQAAAPLHLPATGSAAPASLVLPTLTLAALLASGWTRPLRAAAVEAYAGARVRAARARGLPEGTIARRLVLPIVLRPAITLLGLALPRLVGGTVVVERVFAWSAMGTWIAEAAVRADLPVLTAVTLLIGAMVALGGALADLAVAALEPGERS